MKAWGNLPSSLRRENTENAVANATRVHPWDVKNKTGSRVQTIPRDIPSSTDVPVLLLNHSIMGKKPDVNSLCLQVSNKITHRENIYQNQLAFLFEWFLGRR